MVFLITFSTSITLTSYPQHLALDDKTIIQAIKFISNNTAVVKGNQVQFGKGDVLPLEGRDYIKITGRQIQVGESRYNEGVRTVSASWYQNTMFAQKIGTFRTDQTAQIIVDRTVITIHPVSKDVLSITSLDLSTPKTQNNYNIQLAQDTVYINEGGAMLKLVGTNSMITVSLIGLKKYTNIIMRTSDEKK
jgi:hypothetical protein